MSWKTLAFSWAVAVMLAGAAQATTWVDDFTSVAPESWSGSDGTAVSSYTDTTGANPNTFSISYNQAGAVPAGWLTQGTRGGVATTARFFNAPGGGNGRARFSTPLPLSMDGDGGVSVGWTARYGNYTLTRAPVQIAIKDDGTSTGTEFNAFIRLQNGTQLRILDNNGNAYAGIDLLTLGSSLADGVYHQWSCAVITDVDNVAHWKLWVDGTQLLFTGGDGGHLFNADQYSFKTVSNGFSDIPGPSGAYVGLGELYSQDIWDFEFDCVTFKDDGVAQVTCGTPVTCDSTVSPSGVQTATALKNGAATPAAFAYTFTNAGNTNANYTVAETDASGAPLDYAWLALDKSGGTAIPPVGTDTVVATIAGTNLAAGSYTGYVTFTDACGTANKHTREINLVITDCAYDVWPAGEIARSLVLGSTLGPADAVFTVTNTGTDGLAYAVAEVVECPWLTLTKTSGGPLANGETDQVAATLNPAGLAVGLHTCTLRFTDTAGGCSNTPPTYDRTVVLHVLSPATAFEQFNADFSTFTGSDLFANSPVISCDPSVSTTRSFAVQTGALQVDQLDSGWLTQGSVAGTPTTAKFNNPAGPGAEGLLGVGRARFRTFLPFGNTFNPADGMAVAWRMRIGDYSPTRAPVQITFPRVTGPFGVSETLSIPGEVFNCYIRVQNGTRVSILSNSGTQFAGINTLILPASIAGSTEADYHQWTAAVCYQASDQLAYWNLWIDGVKLLFAGNDAGGSAGSPVGPGGATFSFRTPLQDVAGDPYIGLGELSSSIDIWDFEFDWVRMLAYKVTGCPFWDGEGCVPTNPCPIPFADSDEDGDVDSDDFGALQRCLNGGLASSATSLPDECRCFDRNNNKVVGDAFDLLKFTACGTGKEVTWQPVAGCE